MYIYIENTIHYIMREMDLQSHKRSFTLPVAKISIENVSRIVEDVEDLSRIYRGLSLEIETIQFRRIILIRFNKTVSL